MQHELELSSLGIEVPDPATRPPCIGDLNGLAPGESAASPGAMTSRNDDKADRLIVQPATSAGGTAPTSSTSPETAPPTSRSATANTPVPAWLARLEGAAVLTALVERVQRIELAGEPQRKLNNLIRSFRSLPVAVQPA